MHVRSTSWCLQGWALLPILGALVILSTPVTAAPPGVHLAIGGILKGRSGNSGGGNNSSGSGSISMSVWLPILAVSIVFILFSLVTCIRRCAARDAAASTEANAASTTANGTTTRPRRRPRRTPSQISTRSLPAYMKEPGDQELVLFRGPSDMEDEMPPDPMPSLAEDDDEHPEMALMQEVSRPPELHHEDHRPSRDGRSMDSMGSEAELMPAHQRNISVGNDADPRGRTPSYIEAVSGQGGLGTISLNDPEANNAPSQAAGRGRLRFSFHMPRPHMPRPFGSHNRASVGPSNANQSPNQSPPSEPPALHGLSGSALSRFSTRESHDSHHSRAPSRNTTHSRSNSNLLRAFRSHSPGLQAGSSTISLDSISSPLTHTLTRAEFHAPKGGLLTPEQIKLITSREALERFGVPYGPDAVAAFSRERLAEMEAPPPDFDSATGEHEERSGASGGGSATDSTAPRSLSPSQPSSPHRAVERAESRTSTVVSYATTPEANGRVPQIQIVQTYASDDEGEMDGDDEPHTARPMTPLALSTPEDHARSG